MILSDREKKLKTRKYKPLYKHFLQLRKNVQYRFKLFKFKKKKWDRFLNYLRKRNYRRKRHFLLFDQQKHELTKYTKIYKKRFKELLSTKKRFKLFYGGLRVKYIKNLLIRKKSLVSAITFIKKLESRLDMILYRGHFCRSVRGARQIIRQRKVKVNNRIVSFYGHQVKRGDSISVVKKVEYLIKHNILMSNLWPFPPKYLVINYKLLKIIFLGNIEYSVVSFLYPFLLEFPLLVRSFRYF